jgi:hypothetical protein
VLLQSARPLNPLRIGIVVSMVVLFVAVLFVPVASEFFALYVAPERDTMIAVVAGLLGAAAVWAATVFTDRWRRA